MLSNGNYTKATINGKKCGLVVYNNCIYLLSYVKRWGRYISTDPTCISSEFPRHGFHKAMRIWPLAGWEESFEEWRGGFLRHQTSEPYGITTIAFPGEEGFEREIRRYRRNRAESTELPNPPAEVVIPMEESTTTPTNEGEGIDFYLPNYETRSIYEGQRGYHSTQSTLPLNQPRVSYSGHRIGIELEMEGKSVCDFNKINSQKSNWFYRETDGSLGRNGIELITIPLLPSDAKSYATWQPLVNYLKDKANSWNNTGDRCGLHVHIGREILGDNETERQTTLGKLLIFYQSDIEGWQKAAKVFGRTRCYSQRDGETEEIKAVRCLGKSVLKDSTVLNKVDDAMKRRFGSDRYYALNIRPIPTIEFRKGKGSINADRIIAVITFTEAICLFCRHTEAHELTLENFLNYLYLNVDCGNPVYRYLEITQQDA